MKISKKAILVVSFGTSHNDTREKTIDVIEQTIQKAYPNHAIYRAWTSNMIIQKVIQRDQVINFTVTQAVKEMLKDGVTELVVQPTHVINGIENDLMIKDILQFEDSFESIRFGTPLLTTTQDSLDVIDALMKEYDSLEKDEALVFMGHGTTHYANTVYAALDYMFKEQGYFNVYVGTVEAYPSLETILRQMKNQNPKSITLVPFMIVAGDHAKNDMASDEEDSWYSQLSAKGYKVKSVLKGLGEYQGIRDIFLRHIEEALVKDKV